MPLLNIVSDGNGGSHLPKTKPKELRSWLIGGGLLTIIITFSSIIYAAGAKANSVKVNSENIAILEKDVIELKACQARDLLHTSKSLSEMKVSISEIQTNINWLVSREKNKK